MQNEAEQLSTVNCQLIKSLALQCGFDACGVSSAEYLEEDATHLKQWIAEGMNGEMDYMVRNLEKRVDPRILVPNSKSVVTVILNYFPGNINISTIPPKISRYALGSDYHLIVKDKLNLLLNLIRKEYGTVEGRVFVDSAPVLEKAWAVNSGLGWIGKNSLLINPKIGSYVFIGELVIDLPIKPSDNKIPNRCGSCTKCIDSCPTGAIVSPMVIDSRKCISYLTIEKKTPLTDEEKNSLNGWCFGCDICQEVCPWNRKVKNGLVAELKPKQEILTLDTNDLGSITKEKFDKIFKDTPLNRAGWERVVSNSDF